MIKIGDFSRLSRISIRMLRYYDENGILKPIMINEENGYRYYDAEQLETAFHIVNLREMGFTIAEVEQLLHNEQDKNFIRAALHKKQQEVNRDIKEMQGILARLTNAACMLDKENWTMNTYKVNVKEMPEIYVMGKRGLIPNYEREDLLWKGLSSELKERNIKVNFKPNASTRAYFYDDGYKASDVDVEVAIEVEGTYEDIDSIKFHTIPAKTCASVMFKGSYEKMVDVHYAISEWISQNDKELDGANFCIYHVGYEKTDNPEEFETEVCFPIK